MLKTIVADVLHCQTKSLQGFPLLDKFAINMANVTAEMLKPLKAALADYFPPDDSVLGMMPQKTADLIRHFPGHVANLIAALELAQSQHDILNKAIHKFAVESGQGQMFLQNLQLCADQIRRERK